MLVRNKRKEQVQRYRSIAKFIKSKIKVILQAWNKTLKTHLCSLKRVYRSFFHENNSLMK